VWPFRGGKSLVWPFRGGKNFQSSDFILSLWQKVHKIKMLYLETNINHVFNIVFSGGYPIKGLSCRVLSDIRAIGQARLASADQRRKALSSIVNLHLKGVLV